MKNTAADERYFAEFLGVLAVTCLTPVDAEAISHARRHLYGFSRRTLSLVMAQVAAKPSRASWRVIVDEFKQLAFAAEHRGA